VNWTKLHRDVVFGRSHGRIIWQPIIGCWYRDKLFTDGRLPAPWTGMSVPRIHRALGVSMRPYAYGGCFRCKEDPRVRFVKRMLNETDEELAIETPVGRQVQVRRTTKNNWYHATLKWEVETEEELKVATWRRENATWEWDQARFDELQREIGDLGAPTMYMPRMNVQSLYIEKMGTERGILALYDWPDTVEAYFRATEEEHDRLIDVVNASPLEIVCFGENVHAGTLSPELFLKYHLPACQRRCERFHAAGKFVVSHWDGDTRPLLKYARETGLDGIEAITPKPQGDVTLAEIHEALGDRMFLQDGIPAVLFDHTFPVRALVDCARELIERFAPRLVLGISDEISSSGDLERIRVVKDLVDEYNAGVGAAA
jgi:hypothetical protein